MSLANYKKSVFFLVKSDRFPPMKSKRDKKGIFVDLHVRNGIFHLKLNLFKPHVQIMFFFPREEDIEV